MMNRTYEVIFILRPDLVDEEADKLVEGLQASVSGNGTTVHQVERLGRRRLAYRVRGFREGNYVLFDLEAAAAEPIAELQRRLRISEPVIKYLAVRTDEQEKRLVKRREHRAARLARRPVKTEAAAEPSEQDDPGAVNEGRDEASSGAY